jgi:DNA polymerase-3 subunit gamma/tau
MTYQVLARKWRPKTFETLVGQEHVVRALSNALQNQRLHHAYLLTGTRGVGKTTIARIMAKALNCETGITASPCGVCEACTQIDSGRFVDLLEIDAASNTGIDNIREVLENAQYAPTAGRFKVYIIDEVHMLSKSAFNAMLKTLEEPPPHVKFILATTDPHKVPVTVLSRCLQFSLKQMTPQMLAQHLSTVLDTENVSYEAGALTLLSHAAAGSMRDALSLLDQAIAYGAGKVEEEGVRAMLGAVDQRYIFDLLNSLVAKDGKTLYQIMQTLQEKAVAFDTALAELLHILHQIAVAQVVPEAIDEDVPFSQEILAVAQQLSAEDAQLYYQIALHGRKDLVLATDEFAGFSMTLLRMLSFAPLEAPPAGKLQAQAKVAPAPEPAARKVLVQEAVAQEAVAQEVIEIADVPLEEVVTEMPEPVVEQVAPQLVIEEAPARISLAALRSEDWTAVVNALKGGMSMLLAQNGELVGIQGNRLTLHIDEKDKVVAERHYQSRLSEALAAYFGEPVELHVKIGEDVMNTPLVAKNQAKAERQEAAEQEIQQDVFVQTLVSEFGASIVPNSIKPIDDE